MTKNAITTIPFHGANILVSGGDTPETTLVAMKPVVEGMRLDWAGQFTKLKKHPVLSKGIDEISIPSAGGAQAMTALPLNRLHFWLATIQPNKIKDAEVREKVIVYQTEAADILFDHFFGRAIAGHGDEVDARQLGIAKSTIRKVTAIEKALPILAERMLALTQNVHDLHVAADARVAVLDYVSVRELLDEAKAIQKGRNSVNRRIGFEMRSRALITRPPVPLRKCPHSGVWLYPRDFATVYMAERGRHLVRQHNDGRSGQGHLHLVAGRAVQ